jgi:hypothetical protein
MVQHHGRIQLRRSALPAQLACRGTYNIALKVLPHQLDLLVAFYRDQLGRRGVTRCDEIERLSEDLNGFWIANPADIAHSIAHPAEDQGV